MYQQHLSRCQVEQEQQNQELTAAYQKAVGILGGGFNPVHHGHLIIADQVREQLGLDEFYLMPSYLSPHIDEKKVISAQHRLKMLECAIKDNPTLAIETCEITRQGKSFTYETIKQLVDENPDTRYYFVIGGDMVEYLPKWHRIDELVQLVQFVGVNRPGYAVESPYPLIWVDVPLLDISSSMIRQKIRQGCSVRYYTPDAVIDYIEKEGLYRHDD
ncbi:nicotinic acid mononucleotide adenylyltransferase [Vagococcus penaei]|uniref:Probable nicotinate-nucleotide adenylyltransferase n=1 Tax=Vagococcus penaei TaxID=633807 RepID=A0A1Q2D4J9_9ENTE|nr:nicotinate-nucleotide adenylyltransferase [Vagococcus penaei]RST98696.1 nicotinic acid mononucleotide adenylyltransferase [Vagococcus penaei]